MAVAAVPSPPVAGGTHHAADLSEAILYCTILYYSTQYYDILIYWRTPHGRLHRGERARDILRFIFLTNSSTFRACNLLFFSCLTWRWTTVKPLRAARGSYDRGCRLAELADYCNLSLYLNGERQGSLQTTWSFVVFQRWITMSLYCTRLYYNVLLLLLLLYSTLLYNCAQHVADLADRGRRHAAPQGQHPRGDVR